MTHITYFINLIAIRNIFIRKKQQWFTDGNQTLTACQVDPYITEL